MKATETAKKKMRARYTLRKKQGLYVNCGCRKAKKDRIKCAQCTAYGTTYYSKDPEAYSRNQKRLRDQLKDEVYAAYGGYRCNCCGETTREFLSIDHINNDGAAHRRKIGGGDRVYRGLRDNDFPAGFQILCMNCNFARGKYGACPHKRGKRHAA